jgi:hypothetical protein
MDAYAQYGLNSKAYVITNPEQDVLSVVSFGALQGQHFSNVILLARVFPDFVVIERDQTDKPLVQPLVQAGIVRSQIFLAYIGEPLPEAARWKPEHSVSLGETP